jgi:single-stranded DNA-binding protein
MITTIFAGNIGQVFPAESKNGSKPYIRFSVAVNEKRKGVETTTWTTVFTRQLGLASYLKKGTKVMVIGRAQMKPYYSHQTGEWKVDISVSAQTIQLMGSALAPAQPAPTALAPEQQAAQPANPGQLPLGTSQAKKVSNMDEDDLPF